MSRLIAGVVVLVALAVAPAAAQLPDPQLSPSPAEVRESAGQVVMTISKSTPGRVVYRTVDGNCQYAGIGACDGTATAPDDYGAVSGEIIFAAPGSKTVAIPIVDDDQYEANAEGFTLEAYEGDDAAGWPTARVAAVSIIDDDSPGPCGLLACPEEAAGPPAVPSTTAATARRSQTPSVATTVSPARSTVAPGPVAAAPSPSLDLGVELLSGDVRPGTGFELAGDGLAPSVPDSSGRRGDSVPWPALGFGGAAAGAAAVSWLRRRRWSATRP